ncbi:TPA: hypothetical protein ROX88_003239 [Bacillus pseudomycoides]|nr:hypothetical protein [Bacillus pseudomycoides]
MEGVISITMSSLYNNEIIGAFSIFEVTRHLQTISCAKAMLILPLVSHDQTVSYLRRYNVKSIEQLIVRKPEYFSNFNQRFTSLFTTSINSILILNTLNVITIKKGSLIEFNSNKESEIFYQNDKKILGTRAINIIKASDKLSELLDDSVENLYLQLRVKL